MNAESISQVLFAEPHCFETILAIYTQNHESSFIHVKSDDSSYFLVVFNTGVALVSPELADAMQALHDSEECMRSVADASGDAMISISSEGKITFANRAVEKIFGYTVNELLGKSIRLLIPGRSLGKHLRGMEKRSRYSQLDKKGKTGEFTGKRKGGEEFPAELSFSAWKMKGKTYFTVIVRDITDRRKTQQRIEKLNRCFLGFRTDPNENVNSVVSLCGELLGATCALYNRLDEGMLCSAGQWKTPQDYKAWTSRTGMCVMMSSNEALMMFLSSRICTRPDMRKPIRTCLGTSCELTSAPLSRSEETMWAASVWFIKRILILSRKTSSFWNC